MAKSEKSSKKMASKAAKVLGNPKSTKSEKSMAGSVLTQAADKKKKKKQLISSRQLTYPINDTTRQVHPGIKTSSNKDGREPNMLNQSRTEVRIRGGKCAALPPLNVYKCELFLTYEDQYTPNDQKDTDNPSDQIRPYYYKKAGHNSKDTHEKIIAYFHNVTSYPESWDYIRIRLHRSIGDSPDLGFLFRKINLQEPIALLETPEVGFNTICPVIGSGDFEASGKLCLRRIRVLFVKCAQCWKTLPYKMRVFKAHL